MRHKFHRRLHAVQRTLLFAAVTAAAMAQSAGTQQTPPASEPKTPPIRTTVNVNASLEAQTPASITVLDQQQIERIPGTNMDDRLRQVPGFSLFRRSSSLVANPTTQGVSLRGIGSTGASRTLVLWDALPINDPFGGWVYWTRIDPGFIQEVDVNRGATTSLFGDRAMAGTIGLFTPTVQKQQLYVNALGGNEGTGDVAAGYQNLWGPWGLTIHSRALTTDGYYITPESVRGRVDTKANVRFATGNVNLDFLGSANQLHVHMDVLAEERQNGTVLTHNSTGLGTIGATYTHSWSNDQISGVLFHTQEQFHSTYSSVSADRNTETLSARQTVPVADNGGAVYWQHHGGPTSLKWNSVIGADADDIHGVSLDYSMSTRLLTRSGGTLLQHGTFGQADVTFGRITLYGGMRYQFTGQHRETFFSPNGGIAAGVGQLRFRASGYRSFRAPTLNELYRQFRVGNVLTLANPALTPEGLVGVEAGADWTPETMHLSFTVFRNELNNLVDNATLSTTRTLILRMRQNFPAALSRGVEVNAQKNWQHWSAQAGWMFVDARLSTGQRIPQVPKQQGTAQLAWNYKNTLVSGGIRGFGLQFDDDLNQFKLPGFAALQLSAQHKITSKLSGVLAIENLLDRTYLVALTPSPNTGSPRLWRAGLRWNGSILP